MRRLAMMFLSAGTLLEYCAVVYNFLGSAATSPAICVFISSMIELALAVVNVSVKIVR